jgi:hypothetical protein
MSLRRLKSVPRQRNGDSDHENEVGPSAHGCGNDRGYCQGTLWYGRQRPPPCSHVKGARLCLSR